MTLPTADVSVRVAWRADAAAMAALQVACWRETYAALLPAEVLDSLPTEEFTAHWERSIVKPKEARQRVLVALDRATVRGFTTTAPSADADADPGQVAEVGELVVDPSARGAGHGSRLLHAAVDTMRSDRFTRATTWVASTNDDVRRFLTAQGWSPDGAYRELDLEGDGAVTVHQVRLHTDVRAENP
ncbi:MAG: GNAT family N-acetyltransferase [Nocardioidaceae bacterium]